MTLNKNTLAIAVAGALLFAGNANAQVLLNPIGAETNTPVTYAAEINTAGTVAQRTLAGVAANSIVVNAGYAFSSGEVRYARVECSNVRFLTSGALTAAPAGALFGALNGLNSSAITFSVTAPAAPAAGIAIGDKFTIPASYELLNNSAGTCAYSLYDQPSQAQAGGTNGRIYTASGNFIASAASYTFTTPVTETATANVEASPSFTAFVAANQTTTSTARLAQFTTAHVGNRLISGAAITALTDLMIAPVRITVTGDFTAAANADGTYTGDALPRVWINSDGLNCTASNDAGDIVSDLITATSARFTIPSPFALTTQNLCFKPRSGVAIPASTYTATFTPTAANSGFVTAAIGPRNSGEIVRNGTSLQAPLAQVPAGFISRMALTNTGSTARPYTISVQSETGTTIGTANLTGTIPANGTTVLNLADVMTSFTEGKAPRGTINVTVAAPNTQIQGLYQIVSQSTGAISNHVMVRPGSN